MPRRGGWVVALVGVAAFVGMAAWTLRPRPEYTVGLFVPRPESELCFPGLVAALEERGFRHGEARLRPLDASAFVAARLAGQTMPSHEKPNLWVQAFERGAPAPVWNLDGTWWGGMDDQAEAESILEWMLREGQSSFRALDERNEPNMTDFWEGPRSVTPLWWSLRRNAEEFRIRVLDPEQPGDVDVLVINHPETALQRLAALPKQHGKALVLAAACATSAILPRAEGAWVLLEQLKPPPKLSHPYAWAAYRHTLDHLDVNPFELGGQTFTMGPEDALWELRTGERAVFQVRSGRLSKVFNLGKRR